jgi:hypothetical protein
MCHERSQILSSDYVALIKRNLGRPGPLIPGADLAAIELQRELACPCTTPADRARIRRTQALLQPVGRPRRQT